MPPHRSRTALLTLPSPSPFFNGRNNGEALFERDILSATVASGLYAPPLLPTH